VFVEGAASLQMGAAFCASVLTARRVYQPPTESIFELSRDWTAGQFLCHSYEDGSEDVA
jgi:hypothetical protein